MKNLFFLLFILFLLPVSLFSFEMTLYWEVSHPEIPGFGYDAAGVGDVNNDGFADIVVLARDSQKAFLFFGGNPMDTTIDVTIDAGPTTFLGLSSGDVDGDSIPEVLLRGGSRIYIYDFYPEIDTIVDFVIPPPADDTYAFGRYVTSGGDLNNDGYDEVACSNYEGPYGSYIYWGGETIDTVNYTHFSFKSGGFDFGDVNGDGFDDIIMHAYLEDKTYIFFGSADFDTIPDIVFDYPANRVYISDTVSYTHLTLPTICSV